MNLINVGKVVNTFGIKGYIKVISKFNYANKVYSINNKIYINNHEYVITGRIPHKFNYLIELDNIHDINMIKDLVGNDVYIDRDSLSLGDNEYIYSELVGFKVIDGDYTAVVTDYDDNLVNPLLKIDNKYYIPVKSNYIDKIDMDNKIIYTNNIDRLR